MKRLMVDDNIVQAVNMWIQHGIYPGSCTSLLLAGEYDEAFLHAHPLIKPFWQDHIDYIETLPEECRKGNMTAWAMAKRGGR